MDYVMDRSNVASWRESILEGGGMFGGVMNQDGSGAIIFLVRWLLTQILSQDESILHQYERFVITRADHYYLCEHKFTDLDLRENTIHVPKGEGYLGYTDRHLVVSRDNILDALDILPTLLREPRIMISHPFLFCKLRSRTGLLYCNPEMVFRGSGNIRV